MSNKPFEYKMNGISSEFSLNPSYIYNFRV